MSSLENAVVLHSSMSESTPSVSNYTPLENANRYLLHALRKEESTPTHLDSFRISPNSSSIGNSESPSNYSPSSQLTPSLEYKGNIPLPSYLAEEIRNTKLSSLLGLLPEANLAWMSVDDKLYIWSYDVTGKNGREDFCTLKIPSGQCVVSVGLVRPKKGVFTDVVRWCLIVTTPEEALLCAIAQDSNSDGLHGFKLIPTRFHIPTDSNPLLLIRGTVDGRILMGGYDGCLYEMEYSGFSSNSQSSDPDNDNGNGNGSGNGVPISSSLSSISTKLLSGSKRLLSDAISPILPAKKCRKLNHSSSPLSSVIPSFLRKIHSYVTSDISHPDSPIMDMTIDTPSNKLYTLSNKGILHIYSLGKPPVLEQAINCPLVCRSHLESIARGRIGMSVSPESTIGGMEMARYWLKQSDVNSKVFIPKQIHVVSKEESQHVCLVAITEVGLRCFWRMEGNKTTLAYLRPPPPTIEGNPAKINDGAVVSSYYGVGSGICVLAWNGDKIMDRHNRTNNNPLAASSNMVGDVVQAVTENSTLLRVQTDGPPANAFHTSNAVKKYELLPRTGISEAIGIAAPEDSFPLLLGGRVWQIAANANRSAENDLVETLFFASATPSDAELTVGLPPAFVPNKAGENNKADTNNSKVTTLSSQNRGGLITATLNLVIGAMKRNSFSIHKRILGINIPSGKQTATYRILKQTLAETYNGPTSIVRNKSLTSSYLNPPTITPLNSLATQHLLNLPAVLVMNIGGIHIFKPTPTLTKLQTALETNHTAKIHSYFQSYGYKEGCAMSLFLSINNTPSSTISKRALQAALSHANRPTITYTNHTNSSISATINNHEPPASPGILFENPMNLTAPSLPPNLTFTPSSLHDGLLSLTSRLLRPIWFKPILTVTRNSAPPHKITFLLSQQTLRIVSEPLRSLQTLLKNVFSPAVHAVPKLPNSPQSSSYLLTKLQQTNTSTDTNKLDFEAMARFQEETNIHNLYRLVSRTVQFLSLLEILYNVDHREIGWGYFHHVTFQKLISTKEGQERVQSLLSTIVCSDEENGMGGEDKTEETVSRLLERNCYLFFSAGDRWMYEGFGCVKASRRAGGGGVMANRAGVLFRKAARYWRSPSLVCGRIIHNAATTATKSNPSNDTTNQSSSSPLTKATSALMSIGHVGGVVDVCLVTAANFGGTVEGTSAEQDSISIESSDRDNKDQLPWEVGLYHTNQNSSSTSPTSSTPSSPAVTGLTVTFTEARNHCYQTLLDHLTTLLSSPKTLPQAENMISISSSSADKMFLEALYTHLFQKNHTDFLLRISSINVESYLKTHSSNGELLYKYYILHNRNQEASQVMYALATSPDPSPLKSRMENLTMARHSTSDPQKVKEIQELLDVASIQSRILAQCKPHEMDEPLQYSLVPVSDLYNNYAAPLSLHQMCLVILHSCRHDADQIETLWRSIFVLCFPEEEETGMDDTVQELMKRLKQNTPLEGVQSGSRHPGETFESGEWMIRIKHELTVLGKELYGTGADYTFPITTLIQELEICRMVFTDVSGRQSEPWVWNCLLEVGVGFSQILKGYVELFEGVDRPIGAGSSRNIGLRYLEQIVEILIQWVKSSSRAAPMGDQGIGQASFYPQDSVSLNPDAIQLAQALSTGLQSDIGRWKNSLEATVGDGDTQDIASVLERFGELEALLKK